VRLIRPTGIVTRQSSDVLATADAEVSTAVRFIRDHACDGIKVEDLLRAIPISRRVLESRFRKMLGRTPHDEILRVQLQRVKQLLEETDLPLAMIADRAGFKHVEYLSVVFKRHFHQPPSQYRAKSQGRVV
jgi:LacI family transcriptional regulator